MTATKDQHKEDGCAAVEARADMASTECDERRKDPLYGKRYTLKELQALYKKQYSRAEILAYWRDHCVPQEDAMVLPRVAAVQRPAQGRWVPVHSP